MALRWATGATLVGVFCSLAKLPIPSEETPCSVSGSSGPSCGPRHPIWGSPWHAQLICLRPKTPSFLLLPLYPKSGDQEPGCYLNTLKVWALLLNGIFLPAPPWLPASLRYIRLEHPQSPLSPQIPSQLDNFTSQLNGFFPNSYPHETRCPEAEAPLYLT